MKLTAKIVLARVLPGSFWQKIRLFRHGAMDDPAYALKVFTLHYARWPLPHPPGWTCLELGPGDSALTALIAAAHGAGQVWLVDSGNFASTDLASFHTLSHRLAEQGLKVPDISDCTSIEQVLERCHARYLTQGTGSIKEIPSASVDFIFSNAVLEHVRKAEFAQTLGELARVQKPGGFASHTIDLRDHLDNNLNNLRFSEKIWESAFFANSGFYTNRLRCAEIMPLFGPDAELVGQTRWPTVPLARTKMHPAFRDYPDTELEISTFDVIVRRHQH